MKLQPIKTLLAAVIATWIMGSGLLQAGAANGALQLTAVADTQGATYSGNVPSFRVLVSVVDSAGAPVTGLTAQQFLYLVAFVPPTGCGLPFLGVTESKLAGFYTVWIAQPQCQWLSGAYLIRIGVVLPNAEGQVPVKLQLH